MCVLLYFLTLWNKDGKNNWYLCYNEKQGVGLTVCLLLKNIGQINIVYTFTMPTLIQVSGKEATLQDCCHKVSF